MTRKKSVISLISYDSYLLPQSIESYYPYVDEIVLGMDSDNISWSDNKIEFQKDVLFDKLREIDVDRKINIVVENFHRSDVPIDNDTHERNYLKANCSYDWIFSFDADEVLVNPKEFFLDFCPIVEDYKDLELGFTWFLLYKEFENDYLVIANADGSIFDKDVQGFTAHRDLHTFTYCRWTNSSKKIKSPLAIKHYSFCRPEAALDTKIRNFGHSIESRNDPFYQVQKEVTLDNYQELTNFKTSGMGEQWPRLIRVPKDELSSVLKTEAKAIYAN